MTGQRDYPAWDGQPLAELPAKAFTDPFEFLIELGKRDDFPEEVNEELVELFKGRTFLSVRAAKLSVHPDGRAIIDLWLPFFHDERMLEPGDHTPLSTFERWRDAEAAMAPLAQASPMGGVQFGFSLSFTEPVFMPWNDYCQHYQEPPEFVLAAWDPELDDDGE
jgi:hypothetical protein